MKNTIKALYPVPVAILAFMLELNLGLIFTTPIVCTGLFLLQKHWFSSLFGLMNVIGLIAVLVAWGIPKVLTAG